MGADRGEWQLMDIVSIGAAIAIAKTIPNTALGDCTAAKEAAQAAQAAAEEAASTVTSATVAETTAYLGIE